ncbi:MAG: DNA polymerase III subunit alpha [Nitrospirota bacterium]|nr:DNA polymerase III subunit alpha [Nitrospirota bacterium]
MHHAPFVHLRCHTEYSLLECSNRIGPLIDRAAEHRLPALAITDSGNLFGAVQFYQGCMSRGVKPILGCQVFVAPEDRHIPGPERGPGLPEVLLLARTNAGWRSLMALLSRAHLESAFRRPQVDRELLARHAEGLLCLTGGLNGLLPRLLEAGDETGARNWLEWLGATYGADNVFVELCENRVPDRRRVNLALIELAHHTHTPLVATADSRYLKPEDARAHDALLCIGTGTMLEEENRERLPPGEFHFRSPEEMAADFADLPDALENTVHIAQRCNVDLRFDHAYMPEFPVPAGTTPEAYLQQVTLQGLEERFAEAGIPPERQPVYRERVETELAVINRMGYPGYFLIVWDIIRQAREMDIPVGPGRGSAAGALTAFALRITDIDPLPYNLLFERFLNPERVSLPDIDMDFCMDHRDRVIQYVANKYGSEHVCQIITFGTMGAKAVLRDVARVLDFSFTESDRIAKLVPNELGITLTKALKDEPRLVDIAKTDPRVRELIEIALALEGLSRHASTHAAGVIISSDPLVHHTPLYRGPHDEVISHFSKDDAEAVGLVKFDFLGLKTLTVIDHAVREVRASGRAINLAAAPLDDRSTYALLGRGDTTGIFQLESSGMRDLIVKMQPESFEDLVALLALYRPGPIGSGMLDDFISRKKGTTPITYDLPQLEPILRETYGVIVYQEQVMRIANVVAGYSLGDADLLRRAMGKKKASEMEKQKARFIDGARGRGVEPRVAEGIFDLMAYFAGYGFNKSHSAAYALISFQTAWLKAHHPVPFLSALLTNDMSNPDKTAKNVAEVREMGIPLLAPDINISGLHFSCELLPAAPEPAAGGPEAAPSAKKDKTPRRPRYDTGIRYGLGAIKGVGEAALESLIAERHNGPYADLFELCRRIDLNKANKRVLEALIASGACDSWGQTRATLAAALTEAMEYAGRVKDEAASGQSSLFGGGSDIPPPPPLPTVPEWDEHDRLVREKAVLGFYLSSHPMRRYREDARRHASCTLEAVRRQAQGREVRVVGTLAAVRGRVTKKGDRMAFLKLEDETSSIEVVAFPEAFRAAEALLTPDAPLLVTGTVDGADSTPTVRAERIDSLLEIRKKSVRRVTLRFSASGVSRTDLVRLREVLGTHPGACPVHLRVKVPGSVEATVATAESLRVNPGDDLVRDVERLLGRDAVVFG